MSVSISASAVKELRAITDAGMMDCKKALVQAEGDMDKAIQILREKLAIKADKRSVKVAAEGVISLQVHAEGNQGVILELNCETDFVSRDDNFVAFSNSLISRASELGVHVPTEMMSATVEDGGDVDFETARKALSSKTGENVQLRRMESVEGVCVNGYLHGQKIGVLVELDTVDMDLAKDVAMHIAATSPQAINSDGLDQELLDKEREIYTVQAKESGKPEAIVEKMVEGRVNKFVNEVCLVGQPFVKNPDQTVGQLLESRGAKVLSFVRYELGEGIEKEDVDFAAEVQAQIRGE